MLKDLQDERISVHLLYTDSGMLEMKVYDTLKDTCEATLESIIDVENATGFNLMLDMLNVQPFLAKRWLFKIQYKKVKKLLERNKKIFNGVDTSCFLVMVESYREFKEFVDLVGVKVNQLYLAYISQRDVSWLLSDVDLKGEFVEFIAKSYSRDPEKIMLLIKEMKNGYVVEKKKDIVNICGESSGSIVSFVFSLLSVNVSTERGKKISTAKKIRDAISLSRVYGVSTFRNFLLSTVKDMIYIKEMYLNGDIYNRIADIPNCFEEKKMLKYKMYLRSIIEMNLEKFVKLYVMLASSGRWQKEVDIASFIYDYYESEVIL